MLEEGSMEKPGKGRSRSQGRTRLGKRIRRREAWSPKTRRNFRTGILFISLWIIGFLAFNIYPIIASLYYSFTEYHILKPKIWIGLANYALVFEDPLFVKALSNTIYMIIFGVSLSILLSFSCAVLLNLKIRRQSIYRMIYFLPSIVPTVAATLLFLWVLNPQVGFLHSMRGKIGIVGPDWFKDPVWAKPGLIILNLWGMGQGIVIYLSGLQDVPVSLLEAAELDGASWWQRLRYVTIPMVSPITVFLLIMGVIGMFQYFAQAYVFAAGSGSMGGILGSPLHSTLFYSVYLWTVGFMQLNLGYASALAWIMFIVIMISTALLLRSSRRWAYY
jgi:multiple sugar transport system permease protein